MTPPNTASGGGSGVIALVLILAVVAGVAYYVAVVRGAKQSITTPWQPSQVLRQAVQEIGAERKWVVTGHTQDYATFTRAGTKSCALGCLLLWLFFIGSQRRGAGAADPFPHSPFEPCKRFSRTRLTDGRLSMVTLPPDIG
jgi:hypothetical protein